MGKAWLGKCASLTGDFSLPSVSLGGGLIEGLWEDHKILFYAYIYIYVHIYIYK